MQGQANHFYRCTFNPPEKEEAPKKTPSLTQTPENYTDAPEKIPYAITRYQTETTRLYTVLASRLSAQRAAHSIPASQPAYLVGNKYTLADISVFSWTNWGEWAGVSPRDFPEIKLWLDAIEAREAVVKGLNVPDGSFAKMREIMRDEKSAEEYAKKSSGWIVKNMEEDAERQKKKD